MFLFPFNTIEQVVMFGIVGFDTVIGSLEIADSRQAGKRIFCCQTLINFNC